MITCTAKKTLTTQALTRVGRIDRSVGRRPTAHSALRFTGLMPCLAVPLPLSVHHSECVRGLQTMATHRQIEANRQNTQSAWVCAARRANRSQPTR